MQVPELAAAFRGWSRWLSASEDYKSERERERARERERERERETKNNGTEMTTERDHHVRKLDGHGGRRNQSERNGPEGREQDRLIRFATHGHVLVWAYAELRPRADILPG